MTRVKICGIKNVSEALVSIKSGAWAIGEVLAPSSRQISPEVAANINRDIKAQGLKVAKVGVFVDEKIDNLHYIIKATNIDIVQLHGNEPPEYIDELYLPVIKAFNIASADDFALAHKYQPWAYLFDTSVPGQAGGTGKSFNWEWLRDFAFERLILAGGLNINNVERAIKLVKPMAVDISSGVEDETGAKDPQKVAAFINKVQKVNKYISSPT